jgi:type II secretory pathway component PulF
MDDIFWSVISTLAVFYCGYKLGQQATAIKITKMLVDRDPKLERMVERAREAIAQLDTEDQTSASSEELAVERHGDQLYIFTKKDGQFLAQGSTLQECLDLIKQRFPHRNFQGLLTQEQADQLGISAK